MNALGKPHGSIGRSPTRGITSPAYWVLTAGPILDSRFGHHLLRSQWAVHTFEGLGKNLPPNQFDISWEVFRTIEVSLPTLEEQRRIADFLDDRVARIDQIITARHSQGELLDQLLIERMRSAVAGVTDDTQNAVASPLPWIVQFGEDAVALPMARVLTLQRGVDLTEEERRPGNVPVITTAGEVGVHDTAIEQGPGIVVGRYGSVGNVHWVEGPYWPHNTTLYVKDRHGNDPRWLFYLLRTFPYGAMQARAAVPGVNRNDMATEPVPWIPFARQRESAQWMDQRLLEHNERRVALRRSGERLQEYKQSLITAAVTGEIDVTTAGSGIPG